MNTIEEIRKWKEAWEAFGLWCREYDPDEKCTPSELAEAYCQFAITPRQPE